MLSKMTKNDILVMCNTFSDFGRRTNYKCMQQNVMENIFICDEVNDPLGYHTVINILFILVT